jgi:hypothetical protein
MPLYDDLRDVNRASAICGCAKNKPDIRPDAAHVPRLNPGIGARFSAEQTASRAASCLVSAVQLPPPGTAAEVTNAWRDPPPAFVTPWLSRVQCLQLHTCGAPVLKSGGPRFESRWENLQSKERREQGLKLGQSLIASLLGTMRASLNIRL